MTERIIQRALRNMFSNYDYILFNTFIFEWESDFFAISSSNYSVEVEVKISKADFKKDFEKADKHKLLINHKQPAIVHGNRPFKAYMRNGDVFDPDRFPYRNGDCSYVNFKCPANHIPNKFYYACPEGLIHVMDIPAYAGLIYIGENKTYEAKPAPFLHKNKRDHTSSLLSKYYWKHKNDRADVLNMLNALQFDQSDNLTDIQKQRIDNLRAKFI